RPRQVLSRSEEAREAEASDGPEQVAHLVGVYLVEAVERVVGIVHDVARELQRVSRVENEQATASTGSTRARVRRREVDERIVYVRRRLCAVVRIIHDLGGTIRLHVVNDESLVVDVRVPEQRDDSWGRSGADGLLGLAHPADCRGAMRG